MSGAYSTRDREILRRSSRQAHSPMANPAFPLDFARVLLHRGDHSARFIRAALWVDTPSVPFGSLCTCCAYGGIGEPLVCFTSSHLRRAPSDASAASGGRRSRQSAVSVGLRSWPVAQPGTTAAHLLRRGSDRALERKGKEVQGTPDSKKGSPARSVSRSASSSFRWVSSLMSQLMRIPWNSSLIRRSNSTHGAPSFVSPTR